MPESLQAAGITAAKVATLTRAPIHPPPRVAKALSRRVDVGRGILASQGPLVAPKWGPHVRHRDDLPLVRCPHFFYVTVRRNSGEEIAWVRLRPTDHVGGVRQAIVDGSGPFESGSFLLAFQGRVLRNSELASEAGLHEGAVLILLPRQPGSCWMTAPADMAAAELFEAEWLHEDVSRAAPEQRGRAHHAEGADNFEARHRLGARKVLTVR
eukprot:TRINITY_DN56225_c0_g1_i1.p1 TRINITY_DN56225_c0_g1~~TRINITY_DN56225_c0_g1_i1.p1  ORF type:complete len:244 (-),score=20.30 TRINITY_DN56225_c0_g1_i1:32-664(-)